MVAARRALARMIDTLTSRDRFSVLAFDNDVEHIPARNLADATDRTRFRAVESVARIAARGGTELMQPLRIAHQLLQGGTADRERVIVLVTDGQVGNESQILGELAPQLRNIKVFTLGIDQAVNAAFLRQLAAAGGGLCELVESEDRLDDVMTKVHRRIGTPIATELAVAAQGFAIDPGTVTPAKLPDAYAGAPVVVMGRYRGSVPAGAAIELTGTSLGEPLRVTVPATRTATASWLAASWARAHLGDLEHRYAAAPAAHQRDALERVMVTVSKQYSVLCRFTAFVAIDRSQVVNKGGVLHQLVQPVEEPAGWAAAGAPMPMAHAPHSRTMAATGMARAKTMLAGAAPRGRSRSDEGSADGVPSEPAQAYGAPAIPSGPLASPPRSSPPRPAPAAPMAMPPPAGGWLSPRDAIDAMEEREAGLPSLGGPVVSSVSRGRVSFAPTDAYLASLARLVEALRAEAVKLATQLDRAGLRLVRMRLGQWVEDARSVARGELADAVEGLVTRLSALLARPVAEAIHGEVAAIADALAELADGVPPPVVRRDRPNFWKR